MYRLRCEKNIKNPNLDVLDKYNGRVMLTAHCTFCNS